MSVQITGQKFPNLIKAFDIYGKQTDQGQWELAFPEDPEVDSIVLQGPIEAAPGISGFVVVGKVWTATVDRHGLVFSGTGCAESFIDDLKVIEKRYPLRAN